DRLSIRHEELERRDALFGQGSKFLQSALVQVGEDHVISVVDGGFPARVLVPSAYGFPQRLTAVLATHVDDRCRAAASRRNSSRTEVVCGENVVTPSIDMSMHLDAAWHDIAVGRVYLSRGTVKRAP